MFEKMELPIEPGSSDAPITAADCGSKTNLRSCFIGLLLFFLSVGTYCGYAFHLHGRL
jgi:hypothetical protein